MKIHIQFKAAFQWGIAILLFCGLASCSKVDISDPFVKGGELTFPAKPDSVLARGGKYRLELSWLLISDPKITKYKVYWNNQRDSIESDVVRTHSVDTIRVMFNDWEEGVYNFDIYTYDKYGNRSIKVSTTGKVYGDTYQNSLHNRSLRSVNKVGKQHYQINWMEAEPQFYSANVAYKGSDGKMMNIIAKNADSRSELVNFPNWGGEFSYTAKFLPEPKALDTFYLAVAEKYKAADFSWHNYSLMFGHFGDLMVQDQNKDLFKFTDNGDGTFADAKLAYQGFKARVAISHKNDIIVLDDGNFIKRAPAPKDGIVSALSQLSTGWSFGTIMSLPNGFLVRRGETSPDYGKFNYYPFNGTSFPGPNKTVFGSGYQVYDMMIYITSAAIIAKTPNGELYRMPCDALGVTGTAVRIATDWDDVDYIAPLGNSIVARKKNDELWIYPMNGSVLGVGKKIIADII